MKPPLYQNEAGQGLTEYMILLLLVAVFSIAATQSLGRAIKRKIDVAKDHISKDLSIETTKESL